MKRITFPKSRFETLYTCPLEQLEEDISRGSIRVKLQGATNTNEERANYQHELDRLSALKYISQLRRGRLTREDFNQKVELTVS